MAAVNPRRRYFSPRRDESARLTRRAILDAARELFIEQGYAATSIDQIAELAHVSKPTVFASAGSKAEILKQVRDIALAGDDEQVAVPDRPWVRELLAEPDPERTLRLYARGGGQLQARYAELEEVLHAAAGADEGLRDLWHTNETERLQAAGMFIGNLMNKGPLKPGLDRAAAIDILWLFMSADHYRRLVIERGWTFARFEQWLGDTLCKQLLPGPA